MKWVAVDVYHYSSYNYKWIEIVKMRLGEGNMYSTDNLLCLYGWNADRSHAMIKKNTTGLFVPQHRWVELLLGEEVESSEGESNEQC